MELDEYARMSEDDLALRIRDQARARRAIILAHNYQVDAVQRVADRLGDSLRLARLATKTDAELIVLCGVTFMAESAKILNPEKKVIIPVREAGCPMADMCEPEALEAFKREHPGVPVVCYVNTSAAVKAVSDVCCTSSNAVEIVRAIDADEVIFVPDRNLAAYVATKTEKRVIPWEGYCYVHDSFVAEDVALARAEHPGAGVVVHPESPPDVIEAADFVGSTEGMMKLAAEHDELIVGTEVGLIERMNREYPESRFYPLSAFAVCRGMKVTDLPELAWALEHEEYEIEIADAVQDGARRALARMLDLST